MDRRTIKRPWEDRFWEKVNKRGPKQPHMKTRCWEWIGSRYPAGYGQFRSIPGEQYAHRASHILFKGPIPKGHLVCHECDYTSCIRPEHIFSAIAKVNTQDSIRKRRFVFRVDNLINGRGEANTQALLTESDVLEIRKLYKSGKVTQKALGERFGVCTGTIAAITNYKNWKHVA